VWAPTFSVVPNGVDTSYYFQQQDKGDARKALGVSVNAAPVLVATGRLAEQKGHHYLLKAASLLSRQFPFLEVVLAGDGPLRGELEAASIAMGLGKRIKFVGHQSDVRPILVAADVFVLPSLWEAMPFGLLEAMACGVPAVATEIDGVPEVVRDGVTGALVRAHDAHALAAGICRLLMRPDRGRALADEARRQIDQRYSIDSMADATRRTYWRLLGGIGSGDDRSGLSQVASTGGGRLG
jgi:glycosyltransferase involved in cell wall biosynthesis